MAAPTSNNEVTARRLTRLLVGSDGNGGLWKKVGDKVTGAIGALDVASVGGAGKYISAISETDGKISATATSMDTSPTASSTNAVTSGGVKTALDGKAPTSHASSATTYGVGTTANYGHVKLATGDMNGATHSDGVAVSKNHTHGQYLPLATGGRVNGPIYGYFPSTRNTMVGHEYNCFINAKERGVLSFEQSGTGQLSTDQVWALFDGKLEPQYSSTGIDAADPYVLTLSLNKYGSTHTQAFVAFGWTCRYWWPVRYKVEAYNTYQSANTWVVLCDYSNVDTPAVNLFIPFGSDTTNPHTGNKNGGCFTKFRITIYKGDSTTTPANRWGISEIFYCFPEAYKVHSGMSVFSADRLTTARKTYVTLGTASTTTTRDWSGDTTIPVSGTLAVANGGTGQTSLANVTVGAATKATQDSDGNAINATYFKSSGNTTLVAGAATKIGTQNGADVKLTLPSIPTYNFSGATFYSGNQSNAEHNANNIAQNGVYYWTSNGPTSVNGWTPSVVDGAIYSQAHSSNWRAQIAQDYRNGNLAVRGMASGTWTDWNRIVDQKSFINGPGVNLISAIRKGGDATRFTVTMPADLNSGLSLTYNQTEGDSYARLIILESVALDETVTLSFDVEGLNTANNEYFSFFMQCLTPASKTYTVNSNGRQAFVITKTATVEVPANSSFLAFDDSPQYYTTAPSGFTIKNIKLERGSIATPYSRHPSEDQTKVYYVEGPNTFTAYSASSSYTVWSSGAYTSSNSCYYGGRAYYCKTAISTAEAWNSSHWTVIPTVEWTGTIPGLAALYSGLKIAYLIPTGYSGGNSGTTLNINGLGAKTVYKNASTATTTHLPGGTIVNLTYDGNYWKWADYDSNTNDWVTTMGAYCSTASSIQAKAATSTNTVYTAGETFIIRFVSSNTYAGKITLTINSQGARDIWINGAVSSSTNYTIPAGEHWCHYDGSVFHIWTDGTAQFTKLKASATDFPVMTDTEVSDLLAVMTA